MGSTWVDTVAEIGAQSDVVITVLPGPAQVRDARRPRHEGRQLAPRPRARVRLERGPAAHHQGKRPQLGSQAHQGRLQKAGLSRTTG